MAAGFVSAVAPEDEFYVGYLPRAPRATARWIAGTAAVLLVLATALALVLVHAQQPFATASFEYGHPMRFFGVIAERPYPALRLARLPEPGKPAEETYLLVAPGKHGAAALVAGLEGRSVELAGTRIHRDGETMIEVVPGSIRARNASRAPASSPRSLGRRTLAGEIVDGKCHLGVMKPGEGKAHRDCAARCLSGGAPPLLVARDEAGVTRRILLASARGGPLGGDLLAYVAEPVLVSGELFRDGTRLLLRVEPGGIRRR